MGCSSATLGVWPAVKCLTLTRHEPYGAGNAVYRILEVAVNLMTSKRRGVAGLAVGACFAVVALTACGVAGGANAAGSNSAAAIKIQDERGTLTLPGPAVHVAVQEWQFAEDMLALGVKPTMVADDRGFGQPNPLPPQVKDRLGTYVSLGSRLSPNMEVLASQPVDLIIVDKNEQLKNYNQFAKIAPTLVLDTTSWANFYPNLEKIAKALGKSAEGTQIEQSIRAKFATAKTQLQADSALRALIAVPNATGFFAFTGSSIQAGIMRDLGLNYAYPTVPAQLTVNVGLEALPPLKPDVIFLAPVPDQPKLIVDTWKGDPLWENLPAAKNGRVFTEDRSIWSVGRGALAIPMIIDQTLAAINK